MIVFDRKAFRVEMSACKTESLSLLAIEHQMWCHPR